jgi:hypothetical protein
MYVVAREVTGLHRTDLSCRTSIQAVIDWAAQSACLLLASQKSSMHACSVCRYQSQSLMTHLWTESTCSASILSVLSSTCAAVKSGGSISF